MAITGMIQLKDGTEIEIVSKLLPTKKKATRYARKIRKRGLWIYCEEDPVKVEEFVFPDQIDEIVLRCSLEEVPERWNRLNYAP